MKTSRRNCRFVSSASRRLVAVAAVLAATFLLPSEVLASSDNHTEEKLIRLKVRTIRPARKRAGPTPAQFAKPLAAEQQSRYYIVQRSQRISRGWRRKLAAFSQQVVGYLPENAYLIKARPSQVSYISKLKGARWIGRYLPEYKISPSLGSLAELRHAGILSPYEASRLLVSVFPGGDLSEIRSAVRSLGCRVEAPSLPCRTRSYLKIEALKSQIPAIAEMEDVEWIEPFRPFVFAGDSRSEPLIAEPDIQVQIIKAAAVWERGLTGAGQIVAICDTGLDVGVNGTPMHDDFEGRIHAAYALGRPGLWNDPDGHGTHVAGTAVGNGFLSDGKFRAAAYESHLVFQSGYVSDDDPLGGIPVNLYELFEQVYQETPARIHSDSWGSPDKSAYSLFSVQTDEFVWDHKDFLIVFAAGNDGIDVDGDGVVDPGSLYSPATAKNCITVGASENVRQSGGLSSYTWGFLGSLESRWMAEPIADDYVSDNEEGMAAFSSRGPCLDGRIKPDLVAPGTDIVSCRSQDPAGKQSTAKLSWGVYDDYYVYMGGTSMAAPAVAGCAAVVRQFYADVRGLENPSAALIRATLINGASDMSPGQYGTGPQQEIPPAPNNVEGWGRVDLQQSVYPDGPAGLQFADQPVGLETGESETYEFVVGSSEAPFRATMTYSDYPSSPAAAINLVNDIDMLITVPGGDVVYPNGRDLPDDLNNVESVNISTPSPGIYRVTISGGNVPHGPQPYALVVTCGKAIGRAAISLDKEAYGQADASLTVTLIDADLTASSTPSVTVSSDSDPVGVGVELFPSPVSPNVFEGSVVLNAPGTAGAEPSLAISHDDTISASYTDPDYGGEGSGEVVATARVDLVPPQISDVAVGEITDDSATITWSCSESATGSVRYGDYALLDSSEQDRTAAESHSIILRGLSENRLYCFSVQARDAAGNRANDDNAGQLYVFHTGYTVSPFRDDMEMGEGNWTHYGDVDQWEYGSPTYDGGPASPHSGDFCWGTRLDGYLEHDDFILGDFRDEYLVSPEIGVGSSSKLTFWHWYDLLADAIFGIYDYAYVEVSADGGSWQNVTPDPNGAFTGASAGWVQEEIDLSPFAGQIVQVRFHVRADAWFDHLGPDYQYAGWYIDDVVVSSTKAFGEPTLTLNKVYATTAVPLEVTLIDGDLNTNPDQVDAATVSGRSSTEDQPETLLLTETGPNTGVFIGTVLLDDGPVNRGDGKIQVKEGDIVTISYEDVQSGVLSAGTLTEVSAAVDLTPPAISGLSVSDISTDGAIVSFTTEPTAVAEITYWSLDGPEQSQISRGRSTYREFGVPELAENTLYQFRISVTDQAGNIATYSSPFDEFSFGTEAEIAVAANGFDGGRSAWPFSAEEVWEHGAPTFGPTAAHSRPNCWGTDLDGFYPINVDASLTSDWVTLPENPQLRFWHWYSIDELGWEGAYGAVEITTDGDSWASLSSYAGASSDWVSETVDLSGWAGQTIKIRFRLWSEKADIVLFYYAGWYIDDVAISDVVSYGQGTLAFDRSAYSLSVPVAVTLIDAHLNADPLSRDIVLITLSSSLESLTVQLTETDVSSGRFTGEVRLKQGPPAVADDYLQVAIGDSIVAEYDDQDNGAGVPATVIAAAPLDTSPPLIGNVRVSEVTDTSALIEWTTDVDAIGSMSYAESSLGPFDRTLSEDSYSRQHSVRITGLSENVAYYFKVLSADEAENLATDDNSGFYYELRTMVRWEFFRDSLDREDRGWTHEGLGDVWQWGVPQYGVMSAHSAPDCWATNLSSTYPGQIDASLVSPPLQLKEGTQLSFWHWYSINEYFLDDGEGTVEIKGGEGDWKPLGAGAFIGATSTWEKQEFGLSSYGEQNVSLRFRVRADQWIDYFYPGWYIDDVTLYCLRPFGFGVVQLDQQTYSAPGPVIVTVKDGHLNLDIAEKDIATVTATSTSDPSGIVLPLEETGENTAVFSGEVWLTLSQGGAEGQLQVQYGDTITAHYLDSESALGETNVEATMSARVWMPPEEPVVPTISYGTASEPASVTVAWPYEQGRAYRVYYCDDLLGDSPTWQRVPGVPEPQGPALLSHTEPISPLLTKRFFRVEVW